LESRKWESWKAERLRQLPRRREGRKKMFSFLMLCIFKGGMAAPAATKTQRHEEKDNIFQCDAFSKVEMRSSGKVED